MSNQSSSGSASISSRLLTSARQGGRQHGRQTGPYGRLAGSRVQEMDLEKILGAMEKGHRVEFAIFYV
jgi:hypothetical protein